MPQIDVQDDLELECMQIIEQETVQQSAEVDAEAATPAKKQKNQEEESSGRKRRARTMAQPQVRTHLSISCCEC